MKYSEFLQLVIDTVPECLVWMNQDRFYICIILDYIEYNKQVSKDHILKLRKTVKKKLNGRGTLGRVLGYSNEARINWLLSLSKYHSVRGN